LFKQEFLLLKKNLFQKWQTTQSLKNAVNEWISKKLSLLQGGKLCPFNCSMMGILIVNISLGHMQSHYTTSCYIVINV